MSIQDTVLKHKNFIKVLIVIATMISAWEFSSWISDHYQIKAVYQEPLSPLQQQMKDSYLSDKTRPEILTSKNGTKIYFDRENNTVSTSRPAWINETDEVVLTSWEKDRIAIETEVTGNAFGIQTKPMTIGGFNTLMGGISFLYLFSFVLGYAIVEAIQNYWGAGTVGFLLAFAVGLALVFFFADLEIFLIVLFGSLLGLGNGLSIGLLWDLIDRIARRKVPEATKA